MRQRSAVIRQFRCPSCGHGFTACATASDNWKVACPCGASFTADPNSRRDALVPIDGNRKFVGEQSISVKYGFNPDEVQGAKRLFEDIPGVKIRDNGDVQLDDRRASRTFADRYEKLERAGQE